MGGGDGWWLGGGGIPIIFIAYTNMDENSTLIQEISKVIPHAMSLLLPASYKAGPSDSFLSGVNVCAS